MATDEHVNLAVFAYDFPHKKTQDFLWILLTAGYKPSVVVAAPFTELGTVAPALFRIKPRHIGLVHPRDICTSFGIEYHVIQHNSGECPLLLESKNIDIGVIAGARIISSNTISVVKKGIINFHPGLIPEVRGLDALKWAIYDGHPLGVTAHVIDHRIDAGYIITRRAIEEYADDTFVDLSLRLEETQNSILIKSIELLAANPLEVFDLVPISKLHKQMPHALEAMLPNLLKQRLEHALSY